MENNSVYFFLNNNYIYYSSYENDIKLFFSKLNYEIYFFWGFVEDLSNLNNLIINNDKNKKYLIFFTNDYNDNIDIPSNFIIYRSGLYKSKRKINEFIFPAIYCNNINYSLITNLLPVFKTDKPKICFSGSYETYYMRSTWLNYLNSSDLLECNFINKGPFRGGTINDLIDNFNTSEFCFCPRGAGNFSIRFYETLYFTRIPVILDTDISLPFSDTIDWNKYIVIANTIEELPNKIIDFWNKNNIYEVQINCKKLYEEYFSQKNISQKILEELIINKLEINKVD